MKKVSRTSYIVGVLAAVMAIACGGNREPELAPAAQSPEARQFQQHVEAYMRIRGEAGRGLLPLETSPPAELSATQTLLASRIRELRTGARQGAIFTSGISAHFRRLLTPPATGTHADGIRDFLESGAPQPGAIPLEVNGTYPASQPYAPMPPSFLALLPPLPPGLEYRMLGRDLILLDQGANLIVDYMRDAIPPAGGEHSEDQ